MKIFSSPRRWASRWLVSLLALAVAGPAGAHGPGKLPATASTWLRPVSIRAAVLVATAQNVTVQLAANGTATLAATSVNNGSSGGSGALTYTIQKIVYGQAGEGSTLTLATPNGAVFTALPYASYGNSTGNNGNYVSGFCNGANSKSVVGGYLLNNSSGSIPANNTTFSDPCNGTVKNLAVQAAYSADATTQPYTCADVAGPNYVLLTAKDGSGNTSTATAQVTVVAPPTATLSSAGTGMAGQTATLAGTNLSGATGLTLNGAAATITSATASALTFKVPAGATPSGNAVVTLPCGQSVSTAFTVTTNNALAFDGVGSYVHSTGTLPNTGEFTLEGWANPNALSNQFNAFVLSDNFPAGAMHCQFYGNNLGFTLNGNNPTDVVSTSALPLGRWSHVAVVYSASAKTVKFYVNGVLNMTGTYTTAISVAATPYSLGGWLSGSPQRLFNGKYDEVRMYAAALTQAQVQADMFSTSSAVPASQVAYYNFDQGTAGGNNAGITNLADQSGNGNTGTLTNFALTGTASNWVRSFPTITGIAPTSGGQGTSVTVTGTNLTDATSFAFNGAAVSPFTTPTSDFSATVAVPTGASTGPVSVASATLTQYNGPTFTFTGDLVISTPGQTIAAGTYNSITVTNGGSGTLAGDVTVNGFVLVQSGGTLADGCNLFTGSGTFTLAAGGTLNICRPRGILSSQNTALGNVGAVRMTGTRSFASDASYVYSGAQSQDTGSGLPGQVRNLSVLTSTDITLSQPLAVAQVLTLAGAGNLLTNNLALTLLSSASGTALVVNAGTGIVSGTATVQRYIDPSLNSGLGYRHYAAPVSGATVASLTTAGFTPVVNSAYNSSPTPGTVTPFPTVYGYDQSRLTLTNTSTPFDKGFFSPTALGDALTVGQGYTVNLAAGQLVNFVGTLSNGTQSQTLSRNSGTTAVDAGWQLVGNPYPAPLDYSLVAAADRANLDASIYVYSSTSQYAGQYRAYVNGVGGNPVLPVAQGFFVRVSSGQTSGTLTLRNSQRLTTTNATAFQRTATSRPLVQLALRGATGPADALYAYAEAGATPAFDAQYDALKLPNTTGLNLASVASSGENLAIDGRPAFTASTSIALTVGVPAAGTYTLAGVSFDNLPAGLDAYLRDAQTGQTTRLSAGSSYSFSVSAAQTAALLVGRFTLQFSPQSPLAIAASLTPESVSVYPNPSHGRFAVVLPGVADASTVQAELFNALGQSVRRQSAALPASGTTLTVETGELTTGIYTLRLTAGAAVLTQRVVIQ